MEVYEKDANIALLPPPTDQPVISKTDQSAYTLPVGGDFSNALDHVSATIVDDVTADVGPTPAMDDFSTSMDDVPTAMDDAPTAMDDVPTAMDDVPTTMDDGHSQDKSDAVPSSFQTHSQRPRPSEHVSVTVVENAADDLKQSLQDATRFLTKLKFKRKLYVSMPKVRKPFLTACNDGNSLKCFNILREVSPSDKESKAAVKSAIYLLEQLQSCFPDMTLPQTLPKSKNDPPTRCARKLLHILANLFNTMPMSNLFSTHVQRTYEQFLAGELESCETIRQIETTFKSVSERQAFMLENGVFYNDLKDLASIRLHEPTDSGVKPERLARGCLEIAVEFLHATYGSMWYHINLNLLIND